MCSLWIVNYKHKFIIAIIIFFIIGRFRFILNMLAFKWYKIPTMLLEKVSIHTEILFVHCYNFFLLLLVLFLYLLKIVYYCLWDYKWICCVPVYCTCMVLIFYPFSQIVIISHKGTKKIFRYKNVASKSFYQSKIHLFF